MRISGILHKAGSGLDALFDKLERASKDSDIVIAPDYALAVDIERPNTVGEYFRIVHKIKDFTYLGGALVLPGTMPVRENKSLTVRVPIIEKNVLLCELFKETDRGESENARDYGLEYERGDCNKNNISTERGNIAVEICSDHGHQEIPQNTFLEVILAYDRNAGFWIRPTTPKFKRHILVCDSFKPKVEGFCFNNNRRINIWKPVEENEERRVYELK